MTKKKKSIIGHDPLAWISVEDEDKLDEKISVETTTIPQTPLNPEPHSVDDENNVTEVESTNNEQGALYLVASQDISTAEELLENVKRDIDKGLVNINISNVTRIDASCLQILYLLVRDSDINGYETKITGSSDAFDRSVHLLGMGDVLKVAI